MKITSVLVLAFFIAIGNGIAQQKVTAEKVGDKIKFRVDGNLFTSYILSEFE
ncbi:MAG: hypothetical protein HOG79_14375, partial [Prolixibacteraceae bacterium]|nr:hypothetical protein [Prolixibacteraceae bacterium]